MKRETLMGLTAALFLGACGSLSGTEHDRVIYVANDGAELMTWIRGNVDSGVFLIMTHGGPGGESTVYVPDYGPLEEKYAVVYWDQRGSGASRGLYSGFWYSYEQFGDDQRAVVEAIRYAYEPDDVFLMGHSFGVEVGTEFLITGNNQDLVTGWIPVNGTHSVWSHAEAQREFIVERVDEIEANQENYDSPDMELLGEWRTWADTTPTPEPMERDFLDTVWGIALELPGYPTDGPGVVFQNEASNYWYTSPYSELTGLINGNLSYPPLDQAYTFWDRREEVANITIPVLFPWGRWDPIMPNFVLEDYVARIGTPVEDQTVVWMEEAYHSPMAEQQDEFIYAVEDFIERYRQ